MAKAEQRKHNQTPLEYCILERCHKVVRKVIGFEGLANECD